MQNDFICQSHQQSALVVLRHNDLIWPLTLFPTRGIYHLPRPITASPTGTLSRRERDELKAFGAERGLRVYDDIKRLERDFPEALAVIESVLAANPKSYDALRLKADVAEASRAMASPRSEPLLPRPDCREIYEALYQRHRALYAALRPLFT